MSSLEDKILGIKKQYYCDSDSDNENENSEGEENKEKMPMSSVPMEEPREWEGSSVNTGPKGVLKDWQRYKQLQSEKRENQDAERRALINKLSLTCRSNLDDEREKQEKDDELDKELAGLMMEDDFLKEYVQKRMEEMLISSKKLPMFGDVLHLESGDHFLHAVDKEHKDVTVIIHLYDERAAACDAMDGCMRCLAQEYPHVKFCRLSASVAGLTKHFKVNGVPALLVYKGGNLVGNFVKLTSEFGEDFFAVDVEAFLIENGILQDKSLVPELMRNSHLLQSDDNPGSDFELD